MDRSDSTVDAEPASDTGAHVPDAQRDASPPPDAGPHPFDALSDANIKPDAAPAIDGGPDATDASNDVEVLVAQDCPLPPPVFDAGTPSDAGCAGITLDGGACMVTLATDLVDVTGLAVRGNDVVWARSGSRSGAFGAGTVLRTFTSGGMPVTLASGLDGVAFVALDDTSAYWGGEALGSVPLTGGASTQPLGSEFLAGDSPMVGLVRAGPGLFWAVADDGH